MKYPTGWSSLWCISYVILLEFTAETSEKIYFEERRQLKSEGGPFFFPLSHKYMSNRLILSICTYMNSKYPKRAPRNSLYPSHLQNMCSPLPLSPCLHSSLNPCIIRSICFNVDEELLYEPFFSDFGPLHLGHTFRFCELLNRLLSKAEERDIAVFHCCSAIPQYKTNAAVLMGAYQVLFLGVTPEQAWAPLQALKPFMPFRDASCGPPTFHLQVLVRAQEPAVSFEDSDCTHM